MSVASPFVVLWQDDALCAFHKPSGWLVHRGWGRDAWTAVDQARAQLGAEVYPLHRLDRQTSGVWVVALRPEVATRAQAAFEAGEVEKRYLALVRGHTPPAGEVDAALPRREGGPAVASRSRYRRIAAVDCEPREVSWVEVSPLTGRPHQVRRHMKHIHHPLIGDANYGKGDLNRAFRAHYGLERLALHASSLSMPHPEGGGVLQIHAPLPDDLRVPMRRMGFELDAQGEATVGAPVDAPPRAAQNR